MWSYIKKAINSNLSVPLNAILGTPADTASNATLFGRANRVLKGQKILYSNATPTQNTFYTALSVSNANGGEVSTIISGRAGSSDVVNVRVTVDGGTPYTITTPLGTNGATLIAGGWVAGTGFSDVYMQRLTFKTSVLIEIVNTTNAGAIACSTSYAIYQ